MMAEALRVPFAAHPVAAKYARHVNPAFVDLLNVLGYGRVFTRAQDVWVWDDAGVRYLDLLSGFGAVNLGHNHPRLISALQSFLASGALNLYHIGPSCHAADLAEALVLRLPDPFQVCLFSNGGAESVEAAIKLARAATRRAPVVYCQGSYHGTSLGALSVMSERRMRDPFEPLLASCVGVRFGDLKALDDALQGNAVAAFLVEPIQAEAGVRLPPAGYFAEAKELCERHGALLIFDEVQTGLGRTGTQFAFERENMLPDVLVLVKSLGGGIAPIGATLTSAKLHAKAYGHRDRFDLHSSTFGGNSFACVAALETLRIMDDEGLVANAAARGDALLEGLRSRLARHPLVVDVRGRGLLIAIEIGPTEQGWANRLAPGLVALVAEKVIGQWFAMRLLEAGIICQPATHAWNVLKIEPSLTIAEEEIERAIAAIGAVFDDYQGLAKLLAHVTARLSQQAVHRS